MPPRPAGTGAEATAPALAPLWPSTSRKPTSRAGRHAAAQDGSTDREGWVWMGDTGQEPTPMLEVVDLRVAPGSRVAVDGIGFSIARGKTFGLLGPGTRVSCSDRGGPRRRPGGSWETGSRCKSLQTSRCRLSWSLSVRSCTGWLPMRCLPALATPSCLRSSASGTFRRNGSQVFFGERHGQWPATVCLVRGPLGARR